MILGSLSALMLIGAGTPAIALDRSTATPGFVRADFDGDGFADLAVGVPGEDVGTVADAGAVNVIYGGPTGLTAAGNQLWTQDSEGIKGTQEPGDEFGFSLAAADFDRDGFADLAVGVPGEDVGTVLDAGAVNVIYGSPRGLTAAGNQLWTQDSPGIEDVAEAQGERFGAALAAANFGKGSQADLAIGVPGEDQRTGAVNLVYGSATGLSASGNQFWTPEVLGISFGAEEPATFGWALAAADFGNGPQADLAVGLPNQDVGPCLEEPSKCEFDAGAVSVLSGSPSGLIAAGTQLWTQDSPGIEGTAAGLDHFGWALAAANFGKGLQADLAVGAPALAGEVNVIYGSTTGLTSAGNQLWTQDSPGILGTGESDPTAFTGDGFGEALATANFGKGSQADLAVGVPEEDVGTIVDAGAVNVLYGSPSGLTAAGNQLWHQNSPGIAGTAERFDRFGGAAAGQ